MFILFLLIAISQAQPSNGQDCLSPAQINAIVRDLENSMARLTTQSDDEESAGSGFILRSARGSYMISAHHVVHDAPSAPACQPESSPLRNPKHLLKARAQLHITQPIRGLTLSFSTLDQNLSVDDDLVRARMRSNLRFQTLEAESSLRAPQIGEKILIAGYPDVKGRAYLHHLCSFKGYTQALNSETNPAYALDCDIDYDIAGMSGGVALNTCTGKVIGAISAQEFEQECRARGTPRFVQIAPVSQNSEGEILFGVQHSAESHCYYTNPKTTQPDTVRVCAIGPRSFPRLD